MQKSKTNVTQSEIAQIISKSTFIFERLSNPSLHLNDTALNEQEVQKRLENWCKVVSKGDWEKFQNRIEWNECTIDRVLHVLKTEAFVDTQALPSWAKTLQKIIETSSEFSLENIFPTPIEADNPYPFEDVLIPMILVARQKLLKDLNCASLSSDDLPLKLLTESAYLSLEKALLQRLSDIAAKTLDLEFSHSRFLGQNLLNLVIKKTNGTSSKVQYKAFVEKLLSDGLLAFFQKYPVLARFIAISIDFWVEATKDFILRLNADCPQIQQVFNHLEIDKGENIDDLNKVRDIKSSLSDRHHQGRFVIALTFESGLKLIYKPKNLDVEVTYCEFLSWCNQQFTSEIEQGINKYYLPFKVLNIWNRETYGWVEFVEQLPCENQKVAQNFYTRAGMLLCLLYFLGGNDCHNENLIACGEHPVLVDMETVMHHEVKTIADIDENAILVATNQLSDSVLRTGLLPMWEFGVDNSISYDLSALGSIDIQPIPIPTPVWRCINTDDMHQGYEKINRPLQGNIPTLNGVSLSPNDYLDELVTGFEQMYHFLIGQRSALLAKSSPLSAFRSKQVRFIFRPTRIYGRVLHKAMAPEFLQHGLDWSIEVDKLSQPFVTTEKKPLAWEILSTELKEIGQLDIPYFSAYTDSDALPLAQGQIIPDYFQVSCLSQVLTRLQKLDETDLSQQVGIIQLAFYARKARSLQTELGNSTTDELEDYSASLLTSEQLLEQAEKIAAEIHKAAISASDRSLSWINLTYVPNAERFQLLPLGYGFYDGNSGIAVFLAALACCTKNTQYRDLALGSLQLLQKSLPRNTDNSETASYFAKAFGIGGATGLSSIVYSLVKISQFLDLPYLCEDALEVANLITDDLIASDEKFDIIGGVAGAILGLLALYEKTAHPTVLEKAIACGQHLLKYCGNAYVLKTTTSKPLTGFSHGAAGIAYSLLRLSAVTQDSAYLKASHDAIAYENSFFHSSVGNWAEITPVDDPSAPPVFWSTWCHGAPGIALGRLGGLLIEQTEQILADIEVGLQTTKKTGLQNIDHLCCGNLGRAEVFLVAAEKLQSPQCYQIAQEVAAMVVHRAEQTGSYKLFGNLPNSVFSPCFFQGYAGIGYQLLRLAYPKALPSVLLWE